MSLMGTLAKVAIGVAVAKGVGGMLKGGKSNSTPAGDGGLLGGLIPNSSPQTSGQQGGGLGDLLGSVLGGQQGGQSGGGLAGGLGGLLEQLGGGLSSGNQQSGGQQSGGLGDLLGSLTGNKAGGNAGGGALGDLLGGLLGGAAQTGSTQTNSAPTNENNGSFGDILNQAFKRQGEPEVQPSRDQEAIAALMLRAMIQATKADGELDNQERETLLSKLGDVSQEEMAFVKHELQQSVDVDGLAAQVPSGLEQQVYMMSVMAINLDSQAEAQYLHQFAGAMNVDKAQVNAIHDRLGVQKLYS